MATRWVQVFWHPPPPAGVCCSLAAEPVPSCGLLEPTNSARYLGKNTQPWFLYGANITAEAAWSRLIEHVGSNVQSPHPLSDTHQLHVKNPHQKCSRAHIEGRIAKSFEKPRESYANLSETTWYGDNNAPCRTIIEDYSAAGSNPVPT